jgi:hypothetical protein
VLEHLVERLESVEPVFGRLAGTVKEAEDRVWPFPVWGAEDGAGLEHSRTMIMQA